MDGSGSGGSEDDGVERGGGERGLVGHETLGDGVLHKTRNNEPMHTRPSSRGQYGWFDAYTHDRVENKQLGDTCRGV